MRSFNAVDIGRKQEIRKMVWQKDVLGVSKYVPNKQDIKWQKSLVILCAIAYLLSQGVNVAI
jgi:hypothetical protein